MDDFEYTIYINAPTTDVWEAIVGDAGNRAVMYGSVLRSTLQKNAEYAYVGPGADGDETVHVYGEVLNIKPGRMLSLSEHPGPSYRENHAELYSRMTWTLEPLESNDSVTRVVFRNDQWTAGHPSREETEKAWPMLFSNLKTFVETGAPINFGW